MTNPYRDLLAVPGAWRFVLAGFVGRMPIAMMGIGLVLLVSALSGSYGTAGAVAATSALAGATAAPFIGRQADRRGQRRVLVPLAIGHGTAVATLVACALSGLPPWTLFPAAAVTGMTMPALGSMVRARWIHHLGGTPGLQAAFSLESVADEMIFITGPILVTALAAAVHPISGVITAGALTVTGTLALAVQVGTQPTPRPRPAGGSGSAVAVPGIRLLIPVFALTGAVFSAVDVSVIAFAGQAGRPEAAGYVLASYALGSMVAALWYGGRRWTGPPGRRFLAGLGAMVLGAAPLPFLSGLPALGVVIFFSGLAVSPTVVPGIGLVERLVPEHMRTEGLTTVTMSITVGVAVGASISGRVVDAYGTTAGLAIPLVAAAAAAAIGLAGARLLTEPGQPR